MPDSLQIDRVAIVAIAVGLALLSWLVVIVGPSAPMSGIINSANLAIFLGVWAVGMVAMMLPSLIPMIFMVVSASKRSASSEGVQGSTSRVVQPVAFVLGYFGIWSLVGFGAYFGLVFLFRYYVPFSNIGQLAGMAAGVAVFLAGAYQLSPLKQKALEACRSPMSFVMTRWRTGRTGGALMGLDYGFFCTKCCWAFMAVLVIVGAMNLLWMVIFAGVIFVEKIAPRGVVISKGLGAILMAAGVVLALVP